GLGGRGGLLRLLAGGGPCDRSLLRGGLFRRGGLLHRRLPGRSLCGGLLAGSLGSLLRCFLRSHDVQFLLIPLRRESVLLYPASTIAATTRQCARRAVQLS